MSCKNRSSKIELVEVEGAGSLVVALMDSRCVRLDMCWKDTLLVHCST